MKIIKYITVAIALVTIMAGCDKNNETLCDARDIDDIVLKINEYLASQPDSLDIDERLNDLQTWLVPNTCIYNPRKACQACMVVSVEDGGSDPLGHEFRMAFRGKEYALYVSAKEPFRIVDYADLSATEPNMSDPAKAIFGKWKLIAMYDANGYWYDMYWYNIKEFFSNGSYRVYYYDGVQSPLYPPLLSNIGIYQIDQESLIEESVRFLDLTECYKYSFFDEDKLKLERCIPHQPDWIDNMKVNITIYQRIK